MMGRLWTCADGRTLLVSQMEDSHLANCIAKIMRSRTGWRRQYLERLQIELVVRSIRREGQ